VNPESLGGAPNKIVGGTTATLLVERHRWEEAVRIFKSWTTVEQAFKKQIITALEPLYLEIINNDMVGFTNTTARDMLDHLFFSYGSITDVDLEHNWENMCKSWYIQQPVESILNNIQDCVYYAESGGIAISEAQKLQTEYAKIFATGIFHSSFRHWNGRIPAEQTWNAFKTHFAISYRQHKQMQDKTAAASGYSNADVAQSADKDLMGAAIYAFLNFATSTAADRGIVTTLTEANSRLTKQLEDSSQILK
jgi:hypothetical protein